LLKADKSHPAPEVDLLLSELGNTTAAIPYFGLFQPKKEPIHFNGVFLTPESFLDQLGADELSESLGKPDEVLVDQEETNQPPRVSQLPEAAVN